MAQLPEPGTPASRDLLAHAPTSAEAGRRADLDNAARMGATEELDARLGPASLDRMACSPGSWKRMTSPPTTDRGTGTPTPTVPRPADRPDEPVGALGWIIGAPLVPVIAGWDLTRATGRRLVRLARSASRAAVLAGRSGWPRRRPGHPRSRPSRRLPGPGRGPARSCGLPPVRGCRPGHCPHHGRLGSLRRPGPVPAVAGVRSSRGGGAARCRAHGRSPGPTAARTLYRPLRALGLRLFVALRNAARTIVLAVRAAATAMRSGLAALWRPLRAAGRRLVVAVRNGTRAAVVALRTALETVAPGGATDRGRHPGPRPPSLRHARPCGSRRSHPCPLGRRRALEGRESRHGRGEDGRAERRPIRAARAAQIVLDTGRAWARVSLRLTLAVLAPFRHAARAA